MTRMWKTKRQTGLLDARPRGAELGSATHALNGRVRDVISNVDVLVQVADTDKF